ncbi:MAG: hypothetical protein ACKO7R_18915 [Pseudanabaena sp.]
MAISNPRSITAIVIGSIVIGDTDGDRLFADLTGLQPLNSV